MQLWHVQLQARACPELADAGAALRSLRECVCQAVALQCWAAEVAAQACDRANNGIREGVSICSWQWQVPSVLLDVLGDGLSELNNIYSSSEYTGFI